MNKKNRVTLFAVASSLCVVSCGSGSSGGGNANNNSSPDLNLSNPSDYKNTVTTQQLSGKLGDLSTMQGKIETQLNIPAKSKSMNGLNNGRFMQTLQSFTKADVSQSPLKSIFPLSSIALPGNGRSGSPQTPDPTSEMQQIELGDSCDEAMFSITNYYKAAASGLQMAAQQMVDTLNNSEMQSKLPAGVTKLGASDSFAGGYSVDLGEFKKNLDDEESMKGLSMSGKLQMMAGANDRYVVFETNASSINASINNEEASGSLKLSAAGKMIGDLTQQSITSQSKLNASVNIACENRSEGSLLMAGDLSQDSTIAGGSIPKVSDKMMVNMTTNSPCKNSQGSFTLKIGADFTAEQTDANTMKVGIALDMAGTDSTNKMKNAKHSFEFVMTRDNVGTCKVSTAKMDGQPLANNNGNGRGGVLR